MLIQSLKKSFTLKGIFFQVTIASLSGFLLGVACVLFSGLWVLGILAAVLAIFAILKRPELAVLGILIATSSIVFEDQLPMLSVGGISLHIPDLLLLGMLGLIIVRWLVEPKFKLVHTPLDWPMLVFFGVTLLSTFLAIYQGSVVAEEARRWIRVLAYYLTFFMITNLVRERQQLNNLLNGLFLLATMVATVMVAQYVLGQSVALLPGRVESLNTQGVDYAEITRILPPGLSIVLTVFVASLCCLLLDEFKPFGWLKFTQFSLLGLALIFTFLRSYWGALLIVLALLVFIVKGSDRQKLITWGLGAVLGAMILILGVTLTPGSKVAGLFGASSERISTIFQLETYQGQDDSFNWRVIENQYAVIAIQEHPLLGMGMGFTYRPWDRRIDTPRDVMDFRKHIHNGHLWIMLQSGLLGYLSLAWLSLVFFYRGFSSWQKITNTRFRGIVLGFTLAYLAVVIAAFVNSSFTQWRWTPVIGLMMGINEVILAKFRQDEPEA